MAILDGREQAIEDRAGGLDGRRRLPGEPPCYALLPLSTSQHKYKHVIFGIYVR